MDLLAESVDVLSIGGGSAQLRIGVALSEDTATRVAEAGRDVTPASTQSVLASVYPGRTYF